MGKSAYFWKNSLTNPKTVRVTLTGPRTVHGVQSISFVSLLMPCSWLGYDLRSPHPGPHDTHRPSLVTSTLTPRLSCCPFPQWTDTTFSLSKSITKLVGRTMTYSDFRHWSRSWQVNQYLLSTCDLPGNLAILDTAVGKQTSLSLKMDKNAGSGQANKDPLYALVTSTCRGMKER